MGRVLTWLLTTFRIIVIVVEMIVMLAFLSRFWLDAKNADLNDEIKQKQAQIEASKNTETQFNQIQEKLKIFSALTAKEKPFTASMDKVTAYIPPDVFINSYDAAAEEIKIAGFSPSERSIAQFITNLESLENFEEVSLVSVDVGQKYEGLIGFILSVKETN